MSQTMMISACLADLKTRGIVIGRPGVGTRVIAIIALLSSASDTDMQLPHADDSDVDLSDSRPGESMMLPADDDDDDDRPSCKTGRIVGSGWLVDTGSGWRHRSCSRICI